LALDKPDGMFSKILDSIHPGLGPARTNGYLLYRFTTGHSFLF